MLNLTLFFTKIMFKYPTLPYYLMLIDAMFTDMALVINLTNIQNLINTIGV